MTAYETLPGNVYPPRVTQSSRSTWRQYLYQSLKYLLGATAGVLVIHYAYARGKDAGYSSTDTVEAVYLDSYPIRSMLGFWEQAEREVKAKGLDTCGGQLGRELVEAYHRERVEYCRGEAFVECAPVHRDGFSRWWPYPAAPCVSRGLRGVAGGFEGACQVTGEGEQLLEEMGGETFLGSVLSSGEVCEGLDRTMLVIGRQDQWNPFHVAEDLITTLVSVLIAARARPEWVDTRVQLVFTEGFGMDANHFTPLWDRMGAWAPRRLALDPWDGTCMGNAIHSVGAGASLLSAMGVGKEYGCASTITWAAALYYRHLFGLGSQKRGVNVLWLSRGKLDAYAKEHHDWSNWRDMRHLENEGELLERLREGLRGLCGKGWVYEDMDQPESWGAANSSVRFAAIDPTVHALETQVGFVGHATILVASHGGALGLSLFLPPGEGSVVELQVEGVRGNWHFQHMAKEMGHGYEMVGIERRVDVERVWEVVRGVAEGKMRELGNDLAS